MTTGPVPVNFYDTVRVCPLSFAASRLPQTQRFSYNTTLFNSDPGRSADYTPFDNHNTRSNPMLSFPRQRFTS